MSTRSLLLALVCSLALPSAALAATPTPTLDAEETAVFQQINSYRAQNGVAPLKVSITLTNAAKWLSGDMASKNYFSHTDSLGRGFSARLGSFAYSASYTAENIAAGSASASATFQQWRNSAGHNAKMLNPNYKVIGIGRAWGASSKYGWYWTTNFGSTVDATIAGRADAASNETV